MGVLKSYPGGMFDSFFCFSWCALRWCGGGLLRVLSEGGGAVFFWEVAAASAGLF